MNSDISTSVKYSLISHVREIFEWLDIELKEENIVIEGGSCDEYKMDIVFYISNIENVKRVLFDEVTDFLFDGRNDIMLMMEKKRAKQNVRFHLLYTKNPKLVPLPV